MTQNDENNILPSDNPKRYSQLKHEIVFHRTLLAATVVFTLAAIIAGVFFMFWHPGPLHYDEGRPVTEGSGTAMGRGLTNLHR